MNIPIVKACTYNLTFTSFPLQICSALEIAMWLSSNLFFAKKNKIMWKNSLDWPLKNSILKHAFKHQTKNFKLNKCQSVLLNE